MQLLSKCILHDVLVESWLIDVQPFAFKSPLVVVKEVEELKTTSSTSGSGVRGVNNPFMTGSFSSGLFASERGLCYFVTCAVAGADIYCTIKIAAACSVQGFSNLYNPCEQDEYPHCHS